MKSKTLSTIANLLSSLQKRITKVSQKTDVNIQAIDALSDGLDLRTTALNASIEANRAQSFQRAEALGLQIAKVKEENDKRETQQALRDQNNVQSLVNLKDSTQKAFDQVKNDVQELLKRNDALTTRVRQVEFQNVVLTQSQQKQYLPSGHVWVNKKLTGVYDTTTDLDNRLQKIELRFLPTCVAPGTSWNWKRVDELQERVLKLEAIIKIYEDLRKAQLNLAEVNGAFLAGPKA